MKAKSADDMVQSAIRLPRSLHERLKKAGGERGMGEEIRRRLEASFEAEKPRADPKTRDCSTQSLPAPTTSRVTMAVGRKTPSPSRC